MSLTQQQKAIVEHGGSAVVTAVAGSGKSHTIVHHAKARPNKPSLYLAFNRSVAIEAREKFHKAGCSHVTVLTPHSLAYHALEVNKRFKVSQGDFKPLELLKDLKFAGTGNRANDIGLAKHVLNCFNAYCTSSAVNFDEIRYPDTVKNNPAVHSFVCAFHDQISVLAERLFNLMKQGEIEITHDAYLKIYQLSEPTLEYDFIYADEGQDFSAVMLDIVKKQRCKHLVVGDPHQSLYLFRGAVNALDQFDDPRFSLTTSFRFTEDIAELGAAAISLKNILGKEDKEFELIGAGREPDRPPETVAVVSRSNLALLNEAIASYDAGARNLYFEGGLANHTFMGSGASLYDVARLYIKKKEFIKNDIIAGFEDFKELQKHAKEVDDKELILACRIADKYGGYIFEKIKKLKTAEVYDKKKADLVFGTVHRMKGAEYEHIELTGDFMHEEALIKAMKPPLKKDSKKRIRKHQELVEDVNALYVAITRSMYSIDIPFFIFDTGGEKPDRYNIAEIRKKAVIEGAKGWRDLEEKRLEGGAEQDETVVS